MRGASWGWDGTDRANASGWGPPVSGMPLPQSYRARSGDLRPEAGDRPRCPAPDSGGVSGTGQSSDWMISRISSAVSLGVLPTFTPAACRASFLASAVPEERVTMAPAWPIVLPSGAVNPAT